MLVDVWYGGGMRGMIGVWVMVWFGWGYGMVWYWYKKSAGDFLSPALRGAATYSPACAVPSA